MTSYKTKNSFSQKPSVAQVCSYILYLMQLLIFFIIIQNRYSSQVLKIIMIVLISISFFTHIIITLWTSFSDPSDQFMIKYRNDRQSVANHNVLDMLYCDLCHSYVKLSSRHCRTCGRCVEDFDHHCMWINNCIGGKNYRKFIFMIGFTLLTMIVYLVSCILLWTENNFWDFILEMGFVWASAIIIGIFAILICNLIGLHIYLYYLGITTYQFITNNKVKQVKKKQKQKQKNKQQTNETIQIVNQGEKNKTQMMKVYEMNENNQVNQKYQEKFDNQDRTIQVIKNKSNQISRTSVYNLKQSEKKLNLFHNSEAKLAKILPQKQLQVINNQGNIKNQQEEQKSFYSDKQSIRISEFFTRNKSLNILIDSDAIKPQRVKNLLYPLTCKNSRQIQRKKGGFEKKK